MSLSYFIIGQLTAHILTDYVLQTDKLALQKNELGFKSPFLKWHALLAGSTAWLFSPTLPFVLGALFIGISHFLIDGFKNKLWQKSKVKPYAFFLDQGFHLLIIALVIGIYSTSKWLAMPPFYVLFPETLPYIFTAIFVAKPTNIIVRELFKVFGISANGENQELPKGGRIIGILERWLVIVFIWSSHFEAIGFLIAAKSILRYKDSDTLKTEYVLIGTMLSFGIALILGLVSPIIR
jgi:hypothetical protein